MNELPQLKVIPPPLRTDDERRLHPYCQECKRETLAANKDWGQVIKNCHGVYSEPDYLEISEATKKYDPAKGVYEQVDLDSVREILDPSYWIYKYLGVTAHWYQDRSVRCTSIRKALRWGRRTGKTHVPIAALIIQQCLTVDGLKVLIVTPMKSQALEIVTRLEDYMRENPEIAKELDRSSQQPFYQFEWKNGSRIRIFVAGTAAGSNAATQVRGQEADILILDEMDFMHDDASAAILPILTDPVRHGERISFVISSTPSGKEGTFFKLCHDDDFKEMHIPSRYRPDWTPDMERQARKNSKTELIYTQEYEAEWGTKTDGVFRRGDIIKAMQPYRYFSIPGDFEEVSWPELKPWNHWTYMMGVDWNGPGNGTRIAVVGFDPARAKWMVVYREAIAVEEFALHVAIDRMVQINRTWRCHAVYIDSGYGQMQDEYLRGIGNAAMQAKAMGNQYEVADLVFFDHLVAVDFGSYIEYKTTNIDQAIEIKKKPKKNYMVENFQRHFELDDFWFSKADLDLKSQLMGYFISRQGKHNELIYKADPVAMDHDLDAVMLALFGFNQEFDRMFAKQPLVGHVATGPRPGDFQPPLAMPDPMEDPRGYELALEERRRIHKKGSGESIPSRKVVVPQQQQQLLPGMIVTGVPTQKSGRTRSLPNRNAWRK